MTDGIDLYGKYNVVTDWNALSRAKRFAWIKLSDGTTIRDDYGYVAAGRRAGMSVGGYHYAEPGDPIAQADMFLNRCIALGAIDITPALDLEDPFIPNQTAINFAIAFCNRVRERGFRPTLYANNSMMSVVAAPVKAAVPDVLIWLARYGASPTVSYDVWQYTDKGICPGVNGSVDLNTGIMPLNVLPQPAPTVKNTEDPMQTFSYPGCDKDATGALIEREHPFVVPTGAASSLVDYTWVSFKCCNVPAASVKFMKIQSVAVPADPYVGDPTVYTNVQNDSARVGVEFGGNTSKVDQVTVFVKSVGPYSIVLEHRAK